MRNTTLVIDLWTHRDFGTSTTTDITGFSVEALDGSIGKVDEATFDVGRSFIVVDTGPWIFGKKVMLPAGLIHKVDVDNRRIFVNRTKDEIKNAPEFNESTYMDEGYWSDLGSYYGEGGRGYRADDPTLSR